MIKEDANRNADLDNPCLFLRFYCKISMIRSQIEESASSIAATKEDVELKQSGGTISYQRRENYTNYQSLISFNKKKRMSFPWWMK